MERDQQKAEKPVPGTQGDLREKLAATASNRRIRLRDEGSAWQNRGVTAEGSVRALDPGGESPAGGEGGQFRQKGSQPGSLAVALGPGGLTPLWQAKQPSSCGETTRDGSGQVGGKPPNRQTGHGKVKPANRVGPHPAKGVRAGGWKWEGPTRVAKANRAERRTQEEPQGDEGVQSASSRRRESAR